MLPPLDDAAAVVGPLLLFAVPLGAEDDAAASSEEWVLLSMAFMLLLEAT